jgi:catechol 2,3-dioxygenase-like lactoylglutathione lyase family enzyme
VSGIDRLACVRLVTAQPERLAAFYESAFGFVRTTPVPVDAPSLAAVIGIPGASARVLTLRLGEQDLEFLAIRPPGRSFPPVPGWSPLFQHCAIVVADMAAAYARLCAQTGWTAISNGGPQILPPAAGSVTAFKFRDPENHPLELLSFAPGAVPAAWQRRSATGALGIDHSAISVADTARSIAFYARLGLSRVGGSLNVGPQQDRLDDVAGARVEVTALAPRLKRTPHVELLCYRGAYDRKDAATDVNDIAATELVLTIDDGVARQSMVAQNREACICGPLAGADGPARALFRDPDGHFLCLESR